MGQIELIFRKIFREFEEQHSLKKLKKHYPQLIDKVYYTLLGQLTKTHMHRLFQNLFPSGDTLPFITAIFRIFCNKHGEESLDFKEFLTAMNVTTLRSEEEKLQVVFR